MLAFLISRTGRKRFWFNTIIHQENISAFTGRVCVFAHYHKSEIHTSVLHYLAELKKAGWSIHFITTGEDISPKELSKVKPYCAQITQRKNTGYDFGSYALGYYSIDIKTTTSLLLCNDSVYGPLSDLKSIEQSMLEFDFWGITDNRERQYHIQSYYLQMNNKVLISNTLDLFMRKIKPLRTKSKLIKKYEVGLSQALIEKFKVGSFLKSTEITATHQLKSDQTNLTIHLPLKLVEEYKMPFIKREVVRDNPGNVDLEPIKMRIGSLLN